MPGQLVVNDMDLGLRAALEGRGIAPAIKAQARPHIDAGELVAVLPDWTPKERPNHLYRAGRRQVPPALRAFVDAMRVGGSRERAGSIKGDERVAS